MLEKEVHDQESTITELRSKLDKLDLAVEKHPNSSEGADEVCAKINVTFDAGKFRILIMQNGNHSSLHE